MSALIVTASNAASADSAASEFMQAAENGAQVSVPNDTITADATLAGSSAPILAAIRNSFKAVLLAGLRLFGWFDSGDIAATGGSQNVAHGLGVTPSFVVITPVDTTGVSGGLFAIVQGTHTSTNVVFTGTSGLKVRIHALRFP